MSLTWIGCFSPWGAWLRLPLGVAGWVGPGNERGGGGKEGDRRGDALGGLSRLGPSMEPLDLDCVQCEVPSRALRVYWKQLGSQVEWGDGADGGSVREAQAWRPGRGACGRRKVSQA